MVDYTTVYVEGKVYWAKVVGDKALHDNYDKQFGGENPGRQWAYELVPDDTAFLKENRLLDRLKDNPDPTNPDKGEFLALKRPEFTKDGKKNEPIEIIDSEKNPWDGRLLGNGTSVVAKLAIANFGAGKKKAIYTNAIMVLDLVPYEGGDGEDRGFNYAPSKPGKTKAAPKKAESKNSKLDDLDDDVPF